jgi:hypothetical protein
MILDSKFWTFSCIVTIKPESLKHKNHAYLFRGHGCLKSFKKFWERDELYYAVLYYAVSTLFFVHTTPYILYSVNTAWLPFIDSSLFLSSLYFSLRSP